MLRVRAFGLFLREAIDANCGPIKEAVFQSLALAANPYPRRDDAPDNFEFGPKVEKRNPFSKLIHLKK